MDFPTIGRVGPRAIGPSRFWVAAGSVPEPNADTLKLLEGYKYLPHVFSVRKWTREEDVTLADRVLCSIKASLLQHARFRARGSSRPSLHTC